MRSTSGCRVLPAKGQPSVSGITTFWNQWGEGVDESLGHPPDSPTQMNYIHRIRYFSFSTQDCLQNSKLLKVTYLPWKPDSWTTEAKPHPTAISALGQSETVNVPTMPLNSPAALCSGVP
jgi:hypothetical protein